MATPAFVLALREKIGNDPLWLSGVTAIVLDAERRHLLVVRRRDNGAWTPVTGIIDPGEEPAVAGTREVLEEAALQVRPVRLVDVRALGPMTYANGDTAQYLDLCFLYEHVAGEPYPADGENTEARWAPLDDLPPLNARFREQLAHALSGEPAATFRS
ncbi:NUDIX domain-containing protein [Brachybacterium huguangmaarense]|uniref:NUDIX domain-containing protein n=1 Tax=Brachybacterium huguangmaarense TaxID=1652028 RepID=A0ABY6FZP4_9MICO|nr:NUDIX domain-containing protein [Brachybacterium huguangmaarense]UYG16390.1 NUDIX domain-containing protein [Brachybacterium huguangmaarense]